MVIQRRRNSNTARTTSFGGGGIGAPTIAPLEDSNQISSSEESNGSWTDLGDVNDMVVTAPERCPETVLRSLNDRLAKSQCSERGVGGSLELLRLNLQSSFDQEVAGIVNKYKEKFFLKAVENLKGNLGDQEVSENDLLSVLQKMVQQSATQFHNHPFHLQDSLFATTDPGSLFDISDCEESPEDTPPLPMFNATFQKFSPFPVWKHSSAVTEQAQKRKRSSQQTSSGGAGGQGSTAVAAKKQQTSSSWTSSTATALSASTSSSSSFDILHSTLTRPSGAMTAQFRAKVTWNTSAVTKDTLFVLDSNANKLFRTVDAADFRVTAKHPELIRYTPDAEDVEWLVGERHLSVRSIPVLLLVREEVVRLKKAQQPEWRGDEDFPGFKVCDSMIRKMHKFFTELSIRNQKIRTNSAYFDTVMTSSGTSKEEAPSPLRSGRSLTSNSSLSTSHATLSALLATTNTEN